MILDIIMERAPEKVLFSIMHEIIISITTMKKANLQIIEIQFDV